MMKSKAVAQSKVVMANVMQLQSSTVEEHRLFEEGARRYLVYKKALNNSTKISKKT